MEHDHFIDAVQELWIEGPLQFLFNVLPHFLHRARFAIALEAQGCLLFDSATAHVGSHDQNDVLEVDRPTVAVS